MNRLAKICMVGWTILCFMGSCAGMMSLSRESQGQPLNGAEALGAGIGLFMWLVIWAVPMVVLGIVALVTKPSAPAAPVAGVAAILCPQCSNYHAVNVSFCPHCGNHSDNQNAIFLPSGSSPQVSLQILSSQRNGRVTKIVLISLVIVFAIVAYHLIAPGHPVGTGFQLPGQISTSGSGLNDESGGFSNALQITAGQLFHEYQQNEVFADSKYKGKRLNVTGIVGGIKKGLFDEAVLELETTNRFEDVLAYLNNSDNLAAAALTKGEQVTVQCEGDGMIVGSPVLRRCRIETEKVPSPGRIQEGLTSLGARPNAESTAVDRDDSVDMLAPNFKYTSSVSSIHFVDFSNLDYPIGNGSVELKNGMSVERFGSGAVDVAKLRNVWFLQSNGSDSRHALIYLDDDAGKQHSGFLFLFEIRDGHPVITEEISFDLNAIGTAVSFSNDGTGKLQVTSRAVDGTAECCPEHLDVVSFQWNGSLFKKTAKRVDPVPQ